MVENQAAEVSGGVPFSYVELTSKVALPVRIPLDFVPSGEQSCNPVPLQTHWLSWDKLSCFFRSFEHWLAAFFLVRNCCSVMSQVSFPSVFQYLDLLCKFHEEHREPPTTSHLVTLCDDMFRRQLSKRALLTEPDFHVAKCSRRSTHKSLRLPNRG